LPGFWVSLEIVQLTVPLASVVPVQPCEPSVKEFAGLKHGAQLKFTRVDSFPGGVWLGIFRVPRRVYADGNVYGYNGTFEAKWCVQRR
jgi:hypothetical protein